MGIRRLIVVIISFFMQISLSLFLYIHLSNHLQFVKVIYTILSFAIVLIFMKKSKNLSYHLPWIIIIMVFPIVGGLLYLIIGVNLRRNKTFKKINKNLIKESNYLIQDVTISSELTKNNLDKLRYLSDYAGYPVTKNNDIKYYSLGDNAYKDMLKDLENAKEFIFLEYFIINEGIMWNGILEILKKKAKEGVEVRVMYDDLGCVTTLKDDYPKYLESFGIKCVVFNPLKPFLGIFMNNRDHRKIMVIDGKIAYTGGINIADEYINQKIRFGHWKDNAIRIYGDATWNFTVMFLTLWNSYRKDDTTYNKYRVNVEVLPNGYACGYGDTPLTDETVASNVYINIVNQAKKYVYIYTPYLIVDNDMLNALSLASKRGVDIRIIVPGIPDKKVVYSLTTSYFEPLIKSGVKIYKYTKGFIHSKVFVADDDVATVGSINMDYRSLYLHFECGIYLEQVNAIKDIKQDILETISKCSLVTKKDVSHGVLKEMWYILLRLFAPLL